MRHLTFGILLCCIFPFENIMGQDYSWITTYQPSSSLEKQISPPSGFNRIGLPKNSFGAWLRGLPLLPPGEQVKLFSGNLKGRQDVHYRIVNIDVGNADLQQCADAVMRLRAEYLFNQKRHKEIRFNFTSGHKVSYEDWCKGRKPIIKGNKVSFSSATNPNPDFASRKNLMDYLRVIFSYCGTASLSKEMVAKPLAEMQIGDVFIKGGFPGHAVIIMDMAQNTKGEKVFMLAQSYMPAQQIHILKNPKDNTPWFSSKISGTLETPEWNFSVTELKGWVTPP